jgi:probable rRNA maturation factor
VLCDDTQIRTVKNEVFARDEVTDVIALRYEPMPGIEESSSAEIFVNVLRASQCSRRNGWNPSKELALYIAHGCVHLSGADDATPKQYLQMRRRELRWLRKAAETGLTADLIQDY